MRKSQRLGAAGRRRAKFLTAIVEQLESRTLLSASLGQPTYPTFVLQNSPLSLNPPFTPPQIRQAYGLNQISLPGGVTGDGSGQTIAIVDAYNDPNIVNDVATFNSVYSLPSFNTGGPTFSVENQNGSTGNLPINATGTPGLPNSGWDVEESLDVEWAHAVAPMANIILFEANTYFSSDQFAAVTTAANTPGVSVVSMSFGGSEYLGEQSSDSTFTTPLGHPGVTFLASSGDNGAPGLYPAASPNVVGVGGTSLTINNNGSYGGETAWSGSGGGVSPYESQPAYQNGAVSAFSNSQHTIPDVAWLANPNTGVSFYDTFTQGGFAAVGGTSLACPLWGALVSIVDQGRALAGQQSLDGPTQTLPQLYALPSSDFRDITSGSNGNNARVGYDLVTGFGTPFVTTLVPDLEHIPGTSFTSASQTSFKVGSAGTFTVTTVSASVAAVTESGALPAGVSFTDNGNGTARLAGTPAAGSTGIYTLTLTANNGVTPVTQIFTLTVGLTPAITSANAAVFAVGSAGGFTLTTTGFPTPALSELGSLPAGITFTDNGNGTATLSGTPTAGSAGLYPLTLTATNGFSPTATQVFTLAVDETPRITTAARAFFASGVASTFIISTSGYPSAALSESGALPVGMTFTDNGNGTATLASTAALSGVGNYSLTLTANNGIAPNATQSFVLTVGHAPTITNANHATFTTGIAGTFTFGSTGSPIPAITEIGGLPSGVTFTDNGDGSATLAGTPGAAAGGNYVLTVSAINGVLPSATQTFTLLVLQPPVFTSAHSAAFVAGTAGSFAVTTTGFPAATLIETGTLPAGITFTDHGNGTASLSGTPTVGTGGAYNITLTADNGASITTQTFTVGIDAAPIINNADSALYFITGRANSLSVSASGYPAPLFSVLGGLPAGITFTDHANGTGTLSGKAIAGTYNMVLSADNGIGRPYSLAFVITSAAARAVAITSVNHAAFVAGSNSVFPVTATGYPVAALSVSGTLPSGVTFQDEMNGDGALIGAPPAAADGTYKLTLHAIGATGAAINQAFTLSVVQPVVINSGNHTTFVVGTPGTFAINMSGSPAPAITETGLLPKGVLFKNNGNGTATLSGKPAAGTGKSYTLTFKGTNGVGTAVSQGFTLTVDQPPAITSLNHVAFKTAVAATFTVVTTGFPISQILETGTLPNGLSFVDQGNGKAILAGKPAAATKGTYQLTLTATNGIGAGVSQTFTLTVS